MLHLSETFLVRFFSYHNTDKHFILIREPGYNSYIPSYIKAKNDIYLPITWSTQSQTTVFSPLAPVAIGLVFSLPLRPLPPCISPPLFHFFF